MQPNDLTEFERDYICKVLGMYRCSLRNQGIQGLNTIETIIDKLSDEENGYERVSER